MSGIFLMIFLLVWASIALLIANLISKNLLKRFTKDADGNTTAKGAIINSVLAVLVFFSPITDEIFSYPSYYKMCKDAGKYEFATGMNAKKAFGRQYYIKFDDEKLISLFPWISEVKQADDKPRSVLVKESNLRLIDESTHETIFNSRIVVPVTSLSAIPWGGKRITWLLHSCTTENKQSNDLLVGLRLKQVYKF